MHDIQFYICLIGSSCIFELTKMVMQFTSYLVTSAFRPTSTGFFNNIIMASNVIPSIILCNIRYCILSCFVSIMFASPLGKGTIPSFAYYIIRRKSS